MWSRLQPVWGAARGRGVPVFLQLGGEHFLPGGQFWPQLEPHVVRLHRDIKQHWSKSRFLHTYSAVQLLPHASLCTKFPSSLGLEGYWTPFLGCWRQVTSYSVLTDCWGVSRTKSGYLVFKHLRISMTWINSNLHKQDIIQHVGWKKCKSWLIKM